jgi:long-chain acyl-CoA synthetase
MSAQASSDRPQFIHGILDQWVRLQPAATALITEDGEIVSWSTLAGAVDEAEQRLCEVGVRAGDRLVIVLENSLAAISFLLACSRRGAWAVPVNARLSAREIDQICAHCDPRAIVFAADSSPDAAAHAHRFSARSISERTFRQVYVSGELPATAEPPECDHASEIAVLIYTSGTTGQPKGVMLTHGNVMFVAHVVGSLRELCPDDLVYGALPLSHVYGLTSVFLGPLLAGCSLQLVSRFDAAHLEKSLRAGLTVLLGVPRMYAKLLDHLERMGQTPSAPKLRLMSSGGAPIDLELKRRAEERFGLPLHNGYGLTEASPTVAQTCSGIRHDDDCIGQAIPGIEVRIVDASAKIQPPGDVGEIWVRGPNVMKGYYRNRAASEASVTSDGWLRTGDLGRQVEDGRLYIVGRLKEMIIRSGFKVYPAEIEAVLNSHPGVLQSAVVGRHRPGNEDIIAFVELAAGHDLSSDDLMRFALDRLAPYKRPQQLVILKQLPTTSSGKIRKSCLLELAEAIPSAEHD